MGCGVVRREFGDHSAGKIVLLVSCENLCLGTGCATARVRSSVSAWGRWFVLIWSILLACLCASPLPAWAKGGSDWSLREPSEKPAASVFARAPLVGSGLLLDDDSGIRFVLADGTFLRNAWRTVAGERYYFGDDGYAATWSRQIGIFCGSLRK